MFEDGVAVGPAVTGAAERGADKVGPAVKGTLVPCAGVGAAERGAEKVGPAVKGTVTIGEAVTGAAETGVVGIGTTKTGAADTGLAGAGENAPGLTGSDDGAGVPSGPPRPPKGPAVLGLFEPISDGGQSSM
jgi:hypothetical protein